MAFPFSSLFCRLRDRWALSRYSYPEIVFFGFFNAYAFVVALGWYLGSETDYVIFHYGNWHLNYGKSGCEYPISWWIRILAKCWIAISFVGLTNLYTLWKVDHLRKAYNYMIVAYGVVLLGIFVFVLMILCNATVGDDGSLPWITQKVASGDRWKDVEKCFVEKELCDQMVRVPSLDPETIIERTCCKPPGNCDREERDGKFWALSEDPKCHAWNKTVAYPCFDCPSCKAGYVYKVGIAWLTLLPNCTIMMVIFVLSNVSVKKTIFDIQRRRSTLSYRVQVDSSAADYLI